MPLLLKDKESGRSSLVKAWIDKHDEGVILVAKHELERIQRDDEILNKHYRRLIFSE